MAGHAECGPQGPNRPMRAALLLAIRMTFWAAHSCVLCANSCAFSFSTERPPPLATNSATRHSIDGLSHRNTGLPSFLMHVLSATRLALCYRLWCALGPRSHICLLNLLVLTEFVVMYLHANTTQHSLFSLACPSSNSCLLVCVHTLTRAVPSLSWFYYSSFVS